MKVDPKVFGPRPGKSGTPQRGGDRLAVALMGAAALIAVGQAGWIVFATPPVREAPARPFKPDPQASREVVLTPDELRAIAPDGLTWNQLFQHYNLDDDLLGPTLRRNLGDRSSADMAAAADQPVPASRDIVLVLEP